MRSKYIDQIYTVMICPDTGESCAVDHDHEPIPIEVVPLERFQEVERGRDSLAEQIRVYRETRSKFVVIGDETLWGSAEGVKRAAATIAHLKGKAKGGAVA